MTKTDLYNSLIDLRKKTGQGGSKKLLKYGVPNLERILEELISEGKVKLVEDRRVDDTWICLTEGYCVESDLDHNKFQLCDELTYVRIYLGQEKPIELGELCTLTLLNAIKDEKVMSGYVEWLVKNKKSLDLMMNMKKVKSKKSTLSESAIQYIKNKKMYNNNGSIKDLLNNITEVIDLSKQLVSLKKTLKSKNKDAKNTKDIKELEDEIVLCETIVDYLTPIKNKHKKIIKDIIK